MNNNSNGPTKKLSLLQKWSNIPPKKRIFFSLGIFVLSGSALFFDNLEPELNPFSKDRKDTVYKTIDYSKPKGQGRVTIVQNGVVVKEE